MAPIAGLAMKAFPMLLDNAPEIWAAATQLIQSTRKAKAAIPVEASEGQIETPALEAAIRDIEASLLTLNEQMEKSSALVASLARQNEMLSARVEKLQAWLVALALLSGGSIAIAIAAFAFLVQR